MSTFKMFTRLSHEGLKSPRFLEAREKAVSERMRAECPDVRWIASYAVLGPADYVDIFTAPDIETATKVSTIIRTFADAHTEIWGATPWRGFVGLVGDLSPGSFLMDSR